MPHVRAAARDHSGPLTRLAPAADRIVCARGSAGVIDTLAQELRRLWNGSVAVLHHGAAADDGVAAAFRGSDVRVDLNGARLLVPAAGTSGETEWVLDVRRAGAPFDHDDVVAAQLLRTAAALTLQNHALFDELGAQRKSVIALNSLKDDLVAVLAHDFKGPLTTIIGFTELLEEGALEGDDAANALRTIRNTAHRLATLANDTLDMSRMERADMDVAESPVDLAQIVREAVDELQVQRTIELDVRGTGNIVRGDPSRLRRALDNIIGNALKYSPGGEPVQVVVSHSETAVRVAVSDSGIGIPPGEIVRLFERFARASNAKRSKIPGTGLGLYLAKTIVERHGGTIQVRSELEQGSTFTVVLPRLLPGAGGLLRVEVISADETLASYLLYELRSQPRVATHDITLTAALERLEMTPVDVVIVDCQSIEADLHSLFVRAMQATPPVGLIAVGAPSGAQNGPWHARLPKPFLAEDLEEVVAAADKARMHLSWKRSPV